ncbi:MAG TPA: type II CAAX endopeptidase family protein [Candidatus Saccharimonas sp.]|nr:type II CAAX endopeptidase family protein [Candidatus Saccharimonas sp.]
MSAEPSKKTWGPVAGVAFGFLAYKLPELLVTNVAPLFLPLLPADQNVRNFLVYALFEALCIGAVVTLLTWYNQKPAFIGFSRFKGEYILRATIGFCAYFALSSLFLYVLSQVINLPQSQQVTGFAPHNPLALALAFAALVVIVPIAEELIFRGFIFKGVRSVFSFPITALVVSLLFAVAHGDISVGIDVFALSLVACYMREKTGSVWPGILLHATKNGVAFLMLFVYNVH